jgi:hypothetical protein
MFAALAGVLALPARAGAISYSITVGTSSVNGQYGYIDLQLNQGPLLASGWVAATIANFAGATLNPSDPANSVVPPTQFFGTLPGTMVILGDTSTDYFTGLTFGDKVSLDVTLWGSGVDLAGLAGSSSGTIFQLAFYAADQSTALFSTDSSGISMEVDIDVTGIPTPWSFVSDGSIDTLGSTTAAPEPSTCALFAIAGLAGLVRIGRR